MDYISWQANEIQIRLPGFVDSVHGSLRNPVTLGGGNFIVVNSCGDSAISGSLPPLVSAFSIYYNINQSWNQHTNQKNEVLLRNMDGSGGYTLHLNPISFPPGSIQRLIFAKAMRDWTCYTGMNWKIGIDTIIAFDINHPPSSKGINYVFFTDSLPSRSTLVARTALYNSGGCSDSIVVLKDAAMYFNADTNMHFVYDTIGTVTILRGEEDFYGVCLHELGHFIGLGHVVGDTALMYWTANEGSITSVNRITLASGKSKSAIDGAIYSITQSASTPVDCNGYLPLIPLTLSKICINTTAVKEVEENNTFVVYPNPSQGTFTIESTISDYMLVIMNMLGQRNLPKEFKVKNRRLIFPPLRTECILFRSNIKTAWQYKN